MNKRIWIISDTHFNHPNIIEYAGRPVNYQELIIERWNRVVKDEDLVIHLGDVIFNRPSELADILSSLKGQKILVRGNHDKNSALWFMNNGFTAVFDILTLIYNKQSIIFSHKPIPFGVSSGMINIHGHLHQKKELVWEDHILYSPELENYMPVLLDNLLRRAR